MKTKDTWTAANGGKRKLGAIAAPSGDPIAPTKSEPIHKTKLPEFRNGMKSLPLRQGD